MKSKRLLKNMIIPVLLDIILVVSLCVVAAAAPVTVSVFDGNPGDQPSKDNKIYKLIEQELGLKFDFEFLSGDLDETLGLKIATKDLPDIIDGSNDAEMLENAGVLIDLLPYINENDTPNLYKHLYTDDRIDSLKTDDGKLFIIPNYGINYNDEIRNSNNGPAFFIQKQVVAWDNYKIPTTLNEYFDLIERYVAANPVNEKGEKYDGFAIMCEDWRHFCLINPVQHLMGRPNDGEVLVDVDDPNLKTETFINQPYAKAYYAKLNEAYQKGLISPDTFTMDYDHYISEIADGTVLGMFDQTWDFGTATAELYDSKMYGNTYLALPIVYDPEYVDGKQVTEHYLNGTVMNKDRGYGITVNCQNPELMVKMFDTLLSDRWQTILQWGIEGEDYYIENGRMLMTKEQYSNRTDYNWQLANRAEALLSGSPKKQGTRDDGNAWSPDEQAEIVNEYMSDYDKAFLAACGKKTFGEFFNTPIELAPYGEAWQIDCSPVDVEHTQFLSVQDSMLPQLIMADPENFDALWNDFVSRIGPSAQVYSDYMQEQVMKTAMQNGYDPENAAGKKDPVNSFVTRCYSVILGRDVDAEGLAGWSAALTDGTAAASQIIDGIVNSAEYMNKNLSNEDSVRVLYRAMLGREPDAAGLAGWTDVLNQGYPFGTVINGFCASDEFTSLCDTYGIQAGSVNVGPVVPKPDDDSPLGKIQAFVTRCYKILLGRDVDAEGLAGWSAALADGSAQASQIIDGIVNSPEFQLKGLTNEQKIEALYLAMLNRQADEGGRAGWVQVLAEGNPYAVVINGFCGSAEFTNICNEYGITAGAITLMGGYYEREDAQLSEERAAAFIRQNYSAVLGRDADEQGLADYTQILMNGLETPREIIRDFIFSPEYQAQLPGNEAFITTLYQVYFNREPDAEGLAGWVGQLESGASLESVIDGFANSEEFTDFISTLTE